MKNIIIVCWIITGVNCAMAQEPVSNLYQYNYTSVNPAFAGLDGQKVTTMANYRSTGNYVTTSGFLGYEVTVDKMNSGFGFTASRSSLGPQSQSFLNLLYNYQWKVGKSKIVFGAKVSDYISVIDFSQYQPIGNNFDPLLDMPSGASSNTMLLGLGVLVKTDRFFVGISTDNATYARLKKNEYVVGEEDFSAKIIHYNAGVNFKIASWLTSTHSVYGLTVDEYWRIDLNNTFTFGGWIIGGVSIEKNQFNDNVVPKINAGLKLKDKGQIVVMLYSKDYDVPKNFSAQIMAQFNLK
jgi:type IX secretion system PorP/SprF family membrane protein